MYVLYVPKLKKINIVLKNYFIIICTVLISACKGQNTRINVSADYISLYFAKDKNHPNPMWEDIRRMPIGAFTCIEQKNGDLFIKYNPKDSVTKYVNASKDSTFNESKVKLPKRISNLHLKGIYLNPIEPFNFYQAVYYSKDAANTIAIVTFTVPGTNIIGANFYTDKPKNPLKEENIQF